MPALEHISQNAYIIIPWMILLLPLAGFTVLALFGDAIARDKEENGAAVLACAMVLGSFALSVWVVLRLLRLPAGEGGLHVAQPYLGFEWIAAGGLLVPFSLLLDHLSAVMILTVTGVGSLIHIYSLCYMAHDEGRVRYFSYLNLFTFFMLLLVLGGNLPLMFVGWEGVGLCSYLLIGFWFKKKSASDAGKKAFIVNRIGDVGLILGMIVAFHAWGTLDLFELAEHVGNLPREGWGELGVITVVGLLLFLGAAGKSAQIPLHVWLPDAMEGPTPVSALIHAATMVTAGVYLVARLAPLYSRSETAMTTVAVIGAATALMAATVALVQTDIKRVLAYSTVSQLGYMFLACGVGAFGVGVFHLFTHAFFKALLFLGSGSVITAMHHEQDIQNMGGLKDRIPYTYVVMLIGTLALTGFPLTAGYFSKDAIIEAAFVGKNSMALYAFICTVGAAMLTSFYSWRLIFKTFHGEPHDRRHWREAHESPLVMLIPLGFLAAGSVLAGLPFKEIFAGHGVEGFFRESLTFAKTNHVLEDMHHVPLYVAILPTAMMLIGFFVAWHFYLRHPDVPVELARQHDWLYRFLLNKWYFDELYDLIFVRPTLRLGRLLWKGGDGWLIDGFGPDGISARVLDVTRNVVRLQTGYLYHYAFAMLIGAAAFITWFMFATGTH